MAMRSRNGLILVEEIGSRERNQREGMEYSLLKSVEKYQRLDVNLENHSHYQPLINNSAIPPSLSVTITITITKHSNNGTQFHHQTSER